MEYFAQFGNTQDSPEVWAAKREAEGWHGLSTADHITQNGRIWQHALITMARFVAATDRVRITSAFANNLVRSPVDFAHAALSLQDASGGRFEVGLGSGWDRAELEGMGIAYDENPARARRYREAAIIVRALLRERACHFAGEFYRVDVTNVGPLHDTAPPLVVSLGGPWTIRNIAPIADRVELSAPGPADLLRKGYLDLAVIGNATRADLLDAAAAVRAANPTVPLSVGVFVAVGDEAATAGLATMFAGSMFDGCAGPPEQVAATLRGFADDGFSRVTVMSMSPDAPALLAPYVLG